MNRRHFYTVPRKEERNFLDNFEDEIVANAFGIFRADITTAERVFFDDIVNFYDIAGAPSFQTGTEDTYI